MVLKSTRALRARGEGRSSLREIGNSPLMESCAFLFFFGYFFVFVFIEIYEELVEILMII